MNDHDDYQIPELQRDPVTGRELDFSTGRPRQPSDDEVRSEVGEKHRDSWRDREGEEVEVVILRDGMTAFGDVRYRGDVLRCKVGDQQWLGTLDPVTGRSWLDDNLKQQIERYGRLMHCPAAQLDRVRAEHPEADPRPRPDAEEMAARRARIVKPPTTAKRPDAPLPIQSAERQIPKR